MQITQSLAVLTFSPPSQDNLKGELVCGHGSAVPQQPEIQPSLTPHGLVYSCPQAEELVLPVSTSRAANLPRSAKLVVLYLEQYLLQRKAFLLCTLKKMLNESCRSLQSLKDIGNNFMAILPDAWTDWIKPATPCCSAFNGNNWDAWETTAENSLTSQGIWREQTLQCGHYNAQLQHLIKKREKISYFSLFSLSLFLPSPLPLFFFFQRKFSARERPQGPSHWERVDTFNSPWHIQFTSPCSGCQRHQLAPVVEILFI